MTPDQRAIIIEVAQRHGLTLAEIIRNTRKRRISWPRQEAIAALWATKRWSLSRIARVVGLTHHTTVLYAVRAFELRQAADRDAWNRLGRKEAA